MSQISYFGRVPSDPAPKRPINLVTTVLAWLIILGFTLMTFLAVRSEKSHADKPADPFKMTDSMRDGISYTLGMRSLVPSVGNGPFVEGQLAPLVKNDGDELAYAIVLREVGEKEKSEAKLKALEEKGKEQADLVEMTRRLMNGTEQMTDSGTLYEKVDWLVNLARAQSADPASPPDAARLKFESRNKRIALAMMGLGLLLGLAGIAGLVLFITAIVFLSLGKLTFQGIGNATPSAPFIEVFAGYLLVLGGIGFIPKEEMGMQMAGFGVGIIYVVASFYWIKLRGVAQGDAKLALGTHAGRGVFKEIFMGIVGYVTLLPLLGIGIGIFFLLKTFMNADASHPAIEELGKDTQTVIFTLFLGVIFAPITEELMFRGALFAHLRRFMPWGVSAALIAVIFAALHPQGAVAIPALGAIAINLSIIRYWRGSSIANITAHALNNGTLMIFAIFLKQ